MNRSPLTTQAWALSALLLALSRVRDIAEQGINNESADLALLPSLVRFDCSDIAEYYDNHAELEIGRRLVSETFFAKHNPLLFKYASQIMYIEAKLARNRALMALLKQRLLAAQRQSIHFPLNHANLTANFASVYRDSAGKVAGPIMVKGSPGYLQQENHIAHIRTMLLCAIRAAAFWRSYGGSKWKLVFSGQHLLTEIKKLHFEW